LCSRNIYGAAGKLNSIHKHPPINFSGKKDRKKPGHQRKTRLTWLLQMSGNSEAYLNLKIAKRKNKMPKNAHDKNNAAEYSILSGTFGTLYSAM
jgi:hypothetical protein